MKFYITPSIFQLKELAKSLSISPDVYSNHYRNNTTGEPYSVEQELSQHIYIFTAPPKLNVEDQFQVVIQYSYDETEISLLEKINAEVYRTNDIMYFDLIQHDIKVGFINPQHSRKFIEFIKNSEDCYNSKYLQLLAKRFIQLPADCLKPIEFQKDAISQDISLLVNIERALKFDSIKGILYTMILTRLIYTRESNDSMDSLDWIHLNLDGTLNIKESMIQDANERELYNIVCNTIINTPKKIYSEDDLETIFSKVRKQIKYAEFSKKINSKVLIEFEEMVNAYNTSGFYTSINNFDSIILRNFFIALLSPIDIPAQIDFVSNASVPFAYIAYGLIGARTGFSGMNIYWMKKLYANPNTEQLSQKASELYENLKSSAQVINIKPTLHTCKRMSCIDQTKEKYRLTVVNYEAGKMVLYPPMNKKELVEAHLQNDLQQINYDDDTDKLFDYSLESWIAHKHYFGNQQFDRVRKQILENSLTAIPNSELRAYHKYNIHGHILDTLYYKVNEGVLTIRAGDQEATRKIKEDSEYVYKFFKTIVKARGGEDGLRLSIAELAQKGTPGNANSFSHFKKLLEN